MENPVGKYRRSYVLKTIFTFVPLLIITVGIIFGVLNLDAIRQLIIGATGEEANIQVDTQAILGPMPRPWRNLAQGGEDKDWRIQPIAQAVRALQPEYIRLDHIYDFYDIVSRDGGSLRFDWTKLDPIVSDVLAVGAKPYISLSYTPGPLAPNGDITGEPTNWNEYQLVIQRTIEHLSKERGIDNVIYEVWNEPDLFGKWRIGSGKSYLTLYTFAARGAQQAAASGAKPFLFGGPGITALYENWVRQLLNHASKNNLRIDFISWHRYNRSIDQFRDDFAKVKNWASEFPQFPNLELHITEWGHDSDVDGGYDTDFSAAHTAAVATEMVGNINRGFVFEIQDGKSPTGKEFWGRWGLLTHSEFGSKQKPRYRALRFIDTNIGNQRLPILGKGTWVKGMAARSGDATTIVLANYDPAGRHAENVPVTFRNIIGSNFSVEQIFSDGRSSKQQLSTTSAELRVFVPMSPNNVAAIRLVPLSPQITVPTISIPTTPATSPAP